MTHEHTRSASALVISDVAIRMHEGLYCLNDLHRAVGGEKRHKPSNWLRLEQTCELIEEIKRSSDLRNGDSGRCSDLSNGVVRLIQGGDPGLQGTYVCKELVYAYAMWISPSFHLRVIRAFDALMAGRALVAPVAVSERDLRRAVNRRAHELALVEEAALREQLAEAVRRRLAESPDRMDLLDWIGTWQPERTVQLPDTQAAELLERLDRLGRLFHPFSEPFADVVGIKRLLRGLHPRLGVREPEYAALLPSPRESRT